MRSNRIEIKVRLADLGLVRSFVEDHTGAAGLSSERTGELILAVDEAVSNIVMHGMQSAEGNIVVLVRTNPESLTVQISDDGPLFDPTKTTDPHLEISPLEREKAGGYGLYLLNHLVDRIEYRVTEEGQNELSLVKMRH